MINPIRLRINHGYYERKITGDPPDTPVILPYLSNITNAYGLLKLNPTYVGPLVSIIGDDGFTEYQLLPIDGKITVTDVINFGPSTGEGFIYTIYDQFGLSNCQAISLTNGSGIIFDSFPYLQNGELMMLNTFDRGYTVSPSINVSTPELSILCVLNTIESNVGYRIFQMDTTHERVTINSTNTAKLKYTTSSEISWTFVPDTPTVLLFVINNNIGYTKLYVNGILQSGGESFANQYIENIIVFMNRKTNYSTGFYGNYSNVVIWNTDISLEATQVSQAFYDIYSS